MLKNDYLLAKIGVDPAENEPRKEWCVVAMVQPKRRLNLAEDEESGKPEQATSGVELRHMHLGITPSEVRRALFGTAYFSMTTRLPPMRKPYFSGNLFRDWTATSAFLFFLGASTPD